MVNMQVHFAQLPASSDADRIVITSNSVVVLDGATSFAGSDVPAGRYAQQLGASITANERPEASAVEILENAIGDTAISLGMDAWNESGPSSTVAWLRMREDLGRLDALALGDSLIVIGRADGSPAEILCDDRLEQLGLSMSEQYRSRLRAGGGYDEAHRSLLMKLQEAQRNYRNVPGGYWIASADPTAARQALTKSLAVTEVAWVILATDGAADLIAALDVPWHEIAPLGSAELADLLARCQRWEAEIDPSGAKLPRAKRHDDKTIAVARFMD
ncbi:MULTISPECIES: hypothetical protein [Nocardia]|uniref:Integrase n=1 Tax=Nocardia nova TaxID=37330 RepID=A0A2T2ZE63_9NOCA|nr:MULTISPECIES: hypothetical protein [Nocardia]PSR66013.1 hypothetical protein C8259_01240 [Nocardia nova]